jgi:N-6 DNA Methylase
MLNWSGNSEIDLYPYVREVVTSVFDYPRDHIRLAEKGAQGKIPDVSLVSADVSPKNKIYWIVAEVKREQKAFRSEAYRRDRWDYQLKSYVTADTVYALFIDPVTIAVLRPDGSEIKVVELDKHSPEELLSSGTNWSLAFLHYKNSVSETSLTSFKDGESPSRFLDVNDTLSREKFYGALRISTRELIDFSLSRLRELEIQYGKYKTELEEFDAKISGVNSPEVDAAKKAIQRKYKESIIIFENVLKVFEGQIGKQMPEKEDEARRFLQSLYATEGSSLVLARILFVRFFEDHDMTVRKISNGGIKAFRQYHRYLKDDYQFLLTDAYKEAEHIYRRLFEPSMFDWSHEGDGQLSHLLLRIFYRLDTFDFTKITGDILGNLYERFLDIDKRKKLGEYYTPLYVARYILDRIGFYDEPGPLIDPGCGSGTFLIAAMTGLINRLTQRGVKLDLAIRQAVEQVHGLDINMFAAFIAQLQIIWHLLPFLILAGIKELPELKMYGGINSLEYLGQNTLISTMLDLKTEMPVQMRDSKYKYVVGNPPYIRNERFKNSGPWRNNYDLVDFKNSDVAFYFVTRAVEGREGLMPAWLDQGGRMCFVLPLGIGDSDAATSLRQVLLRYKILEVTDLEDVAIHIFPSPQASGRATVAPILLFVEKNMVDKKHKIKIVQVNEKAALEGRFAKQWVSTSEVPQNLFHKGKVNPFGQFLTKLRDEDLPILDILFNNDTLERFSYRPTPCYGIELRGTKIAAEPSPGHLPMGKGQNVHTYYLNLESTRYVDVSTVPKKSIWGYTEIINRKSAFALSNIALTLQCARFDPSKFTLDSAAMLFAPIEGYIDFPWDCLLNSSILRYVQLLTLRAGLVGVGTPIEGGRRVAWCHIYPRVLKHLPVPQILLDDPKKLRSIAGKLNDSTKSIATRWTTVDELIKKSTKRPLSLYNIDFTNWQHDINFRSDFSLAKEGNNWSLRPLAEDQSTFQYVTGNYSLLNVVKYILEESGAETLRAIELQDLKIPEDYQKISKLVDEALDPNSADISEFKKLHQEADAIIAESYGLNAAQLKYIKNRLSSPPLDVLVPRWPWKVAAIRDIQEYDSDRFA